MIVSAIKLRHWRISMVWIGDSTGSAHSYFPWFLQSNGTACCYRGWFRGPYFCLMLISAAYGAVSGKPSVASSILPINPKLAAWGFPFGTVRTPSLSVDSKPRQMKPKVGFDPFRLRAQIATNNYCPMPPSQHPPPPVPNSAPPRRRNPRTSVTAGSHLLLGVVFRGEKLAPF